MLARTVVSRTRLRSRLSDRPLHEAALMGLHSTVPASTPWTRGLSDARRLGHLCCTTTVSEYAYLGMGSGVGTELPQPDVFRRRWTWAATYGELDWFNRPLTSMWTKVMTTDLPFYDVDIACYERGASRGRRTNSCTRRAGSAPATASSARRTSFTRVPV